MLTHQKTPRTREEGPLVLTEASSGDGLFQE